jgi:hypothetical protein
MKYVFASERALLHIFMFMLQLVRSCTHQIHKLSTMLARSLDGWGQGLSGNNGGNRTNGSGKPVAQRNRQDQQQEHEQRHGHGREGIDGSRAHTQELPVQVPVHMSLHRRERELLGLFEDPTTTGGGEHGDLEQRWWQDAAGYQHRVDTIDLAKENERARDGRQQAAGAASGNGSGCSGEADRSMAASTAAKAAAVACKAAADAGACWVLRQWWANCTEDRPFVVRADAGSLRRFASSKRKKDTKGS